MKKRLLLTLPLLSLVLAGCGVIAGLIPPIAVGDVLGASGQHVTTSAFQAVAGTASTQVQRESVAQSQTSKQYSFPNQSFDLHGFSISALTSQLGVEPTVKLTRVDASKTFPASFTIDHLSATMTVSDENGSQSMSQSRSVNLTFQQDVSSCTSTTCNYTYAGTAQDLANALTVALTSADSSKIMNIVNIIRTGQQSNTGDFQVTVTGSLNLAGFTATFTTTTTDGVVIKLGG